MNVSGLLFRFQRRCLVAVLILFCLVLGRSGGAGVCGDCNSDGQVDVGDAVSMIDFIFKSGNGPVSAGDGDANCDGHINVSDVVFIVNHVFRGGPEPCLWCLPGNQSYFFEISFVNFAWGSTRHGIYIDAEGNINSYTYAQDEIIFPVPDPMLPVTAAELEERYSHAPQVVGAVSLMQLTEMASLIVSAEEGPLSTPVVRCFDFGGLSFMAYRLDETTSLYMPVLLETAGDMAQVNLGHAATCLVEWLIAVAYDGVAPPCRY